MSVGEYAVTYLVIVRGDSYKQEGRGQKIVSATVQPPDSVPAGAVVVRLRIAVPGEAFRPLSLSVDVVAPEIASPDAQSSVVAAAQPEDES